MKIGIIGGGQLAQMLVLAGFPLGFEFLCLEKDKNCPAGAIAPIFVSEYDDVDSLKKFAQQVDVLTYEFENVSLTALNQINNSVPIHPTLNALEVSQDRLAEKNFFTRLNIPSTHYRSVTNFEELETAMQQIGFPAVVKTRRMGYDGKGQYVIREQKDIPLAWKALQSESLIVENFIKFDREVSLIAARSINGEIAFYPLTENRHREGILSVSLAPYRNQEVELLAQKYLHDILTELNYAGILTVEFFQVGNQLYANEMAPRVHNSGHWTIEGAVVSQFENHLRAISGLALGSTSTLGHCAMLNLIGELPNMREIFKIPEAHVHLYGKEPRPKRKLGHVTLALQDERLFTSQFQKLSKQVDLI